MRGLEQRRIQHRIGAKVGRVQALVDWSLEGQHHHSILHVGGGLSSCRTQRYITMYIFWGTRTLPQGCSIFSWLLLPCFCILSLKRPVQGQALWPGLDHKNGLGQDGFSFFFFFNYFFPFFFLNSYQFYTHHFIHVNPSRPVQHTTIPTPPQFSPLGVHTFVLCICVSTSALQPGSSVPFF